MAIDPNLLILKSVGDLPTKITPNSEDKFLIYDGAELKKSEWGNVYSQLKSGVIGIATQTNSPTPYSVGTYPNGLFQTYVVRTPITSPNSWGNIAVTQAELDTNFVYFDVTNGVVKKTLSLKPAGSKIENWIPKAYSAGAQAFKDLTLYEVNANKSALPSDIPSEKSLIWRAVVGGDSADIKYALNGVLSDTPIFSPNLTFNAGIYTVSGVFQSNEYNKAVTFPTNGYKWLKFTGNVLSMGNATEMAVYKTMIGKTSTGTFRVLIESFNAAAIVNLTINIEGITDIYINKSNSVESPKIILSNARTVLDVINDKIGPLEIEINRLKDLIPSLEVTSYESINPNTASLGLLKTDNTIFPGDTWKSILNIPIPVGYSTLYCFFKRYSATYSTQLTEYCSVLGIRSDGSFKILLEGDLSLAKLEEGVDIDVSGFSKISVCWDERGHMEWQPIIEFRKYGYREFKKESTPGVIGINKTAVVSFIDDDIFSYALAELAPFYRRLKVPFGLAIIGNSVTGLTKGRLIEFNKFKMYEPLNHTVNHKNTHHSMTYAEQLSEIGGCHNILNNLGIRPTAYVSPWGRFNQTTLDVIREIGYKSHYRFDYDNGKNDNSDFYNYGIRRISFGSEFDSVGNSKTLAEAKLLVDQAIINRELLVVTTHYRKNASNIPTFFADLEALIVYIRSKNIPILAPQEASDKFMNVLEFENGYRITRNGTVKNTPQEVPVYPGS